MTPPANVERKPLSGAAKLALNLLNERTQAAINDILAAAAADQGIDPAEGWGFDPGTATWARQVPAPE